MSKGGVTYGILENVERFIGENGSDGYSVGNSLTIADVFVFSTCGMLVSGLYDGVPLDAIDGDFPKIMAVRKTVRSNEAVQKWYDGLDESIQVPASYGPFE